MAHRDSPLLNYESRRQSNPSKIEELGISSTKGIYSKIKGELLAQRADSPHKDYEFLRGTHSVHIQEEEKIWGKSESSERVSDQVPLEPEKPTISALSFPTDIVSNPKEEPEHSDN